jgi:hypothetical protein
MLGAFGSFNGELCGAGAIDRESRSTQASYSELDRRAGPSDNPRAFGKFMSAHFRRSPQVPHSCNWPSGANEQQEQG